MPKQKVNGMTKEQWFVYETKQQQVDSAGSSEYATEWEYRIAMMEEFKITDNWAYEVVKRLIKKYENLGQLTVEKIWYRDGDDKIWHDRLLTWKEELLAENLWKD